MTLRVTTAATLAFFIIGVALERPAEAQWGGQRAPGGAMPAASYSNGSPAYYQSPTPAEGYVAPRTNGSGPTSSVMGGPSGGTMSGPTSGQSSRYYEPQSQSQLQPQSQVMTSEGGQYGGGQMMSDGGYYGEGCSSGGGGYCSDGCSSCASGCGTGCGDSCGGGSMWSLCGLGCDPFSSACPGGSYYVTADYLYVRSDFSEAVSYLEQDDSQQNVGRDTFHQLDFRFESSYRIGGGYRLCNCGEEVRFMFTRLGSNASDVAPSGSFLPYEVSSPPDGHTNITASVDVKSYDVSFAKTIPLGSPLCSCGDSCGCGSGCGDSCGCDSSCGSGCGSCNSCPAWEVTWSGGVRFADVDWRRSFVAVDDEDTVTTNAHALMKFRGGGPRLGLEGRRYFCDGGCLSAYLKGDISLLLGDLSLNSHRTVVGGSVPDVDNFQSIHCRHIIPVTEIEAGLTGQVTSCASVTAGYMFAAWHDLGFRDEFNFPTFMETHYDDANILGFDGFFARLEVAF